MSKLLLEGVTVDRVSIVGCDSLGNLDVAVELSSRWTEEIADEMGWAGDEAVKTPPATWKKVSLDGALDGVNLALEPNKPELKDYRISINIEKVSGFKFTADYDGVTKLASNRRLHCKVETHHDGAFIHLAHLAQKMLPGGLTCSATVTYVDPDEGEDDKQTRIPGTEPKKRGRRKAEVTPITSASETVQ